MLCREKTGKTASPRSIGAEDAMKKIKKPPKKLSSSTKLTQTSKSKTTIKEDTGKLLLDIGKLVLATIVLGTILRYDFTREQLLTVGIAFVIVLFICGIILGAKKKNGDNGNQTEEKE